jgi:hypothetical protein
VSNDIVGDSMKTELTKKFNSFLGEHDWDGQTKVACTYSFFHTLNLVNKNIKLSDADKEPVFDDDAADIRDRAIDEAIQAIKQCEVISPSPGVNRIRLDSAVGALLSLK